MKVFETKINQSDSDFISSVIMQGNMGFGPNVDLFEHRFAELSESTYNVSVSSASSAAFMIFAYLKKKYGECDVYMPSLGFASPAWAVKHHGHNIIWVEVNENLLFDIEDYRQKRRFACERYTDGGIKPVLMPILYGGVSDIPGFDTIDKDNYREIVVTDSAHCVTPKIKSDFTFFSFHPYKPIASSDGGMISTEDLEAYEWFCKYRNFGRETVGGSYDITMDGFKFYMNNLNATIALTQLDRYQENLKVRKNNFDKLKSTNLPGRLLPHDEYSSYYFATLIMEDKHINDLVARYPTSRHYPLLHKTKYFYSSSLLGFTESIHTRILNLPLHKEI